MVSQFHHRPVTVLYGVHPLPDIRKRECGCFEDLARQATAARVCPIVGVDVDQSNPCGFGGDGGTEGCIQSHISETSQSKAAVAGRFELS